MIDGSILDGKITFWTVNFTKSRKQPQTVNTGNEQDLSLAQCLGSSCACAGCIYRGPQRCVSNVVQQTLFKLQDRTENLKDDIITACYSVVRAVNMNITHVMCAFLTKAVQGSGIRPQVSLSCQETYPLPDVSHVFSKHCTPPFPFVNTNGLSCCAAPTTKAFVKMEYRCRHGILG